MNARETLDALNSAWRARRFDEFPQYVDENIVMKGGPGLKVQIRGRAAFVKSYSDFMSRSTIVEYAESNHSVDEWGSTAIATFDWAMIWEQGGKQSSGTGQDLFVFEKRESRWVAVTRVMLF